ncbi:hypothetical protein DUI87_13663 [Hirundo rustica rustica]|uniref:Integrase-type domain-containing protein n=1 Tax=Hirundo rustica rustica TaxID=333673 RepID=A0A3M0K9K8_HIRRU|nr:hypothetical protein DUI87_13663 [Hirundo rustica rustica]
MVERTHSTIKRVLRQQQRILKVETPTINFLNCSFEGLNPPIIRHFGSSSLFSIKERPPVMVRDPESGRAEGPHDLVTWGRGYACVSTPTGPRWIPSKWGQKESYHQIRPISTMPEGWCDQTVEVVRPSTFGGSPEEEGLELEEVLEGAPEDDGQNPDEDDHGLGYPTQHHPASEYLPPLFQFRSS